MNRQMFRLFIGCVVTCFQISLCVAEDFSDQLPRIAPTEANAALERFEVVDGFQIRLVASEPLVTSPVAIEWAADGALFVCEMRGYSEDRDEKLSRITRLIDRNNDGVYDDKTNFAEGLLWPTAIFPYDGGVFVADAPNIYFFKDNDGDGVADEQRVVFSGFSHGNVQGLMNSFRWGLDNRIHLACSSVGGTVRRHDQEAGDAVEVRGHDFAFDPESLEYSLTSGGAQHGMCFDDWGRKFVSSNSDHLQQVFYEDRYIARNPWMNAPSARQSIAADGPQAEVFRISPIEPWRIVRTRLRVAGLVGGPVEGGGRAAGYFTGATGVTIFRGDAWPKSPQPIAIVGDVGSNLIHRKRLDPNGVAFIGRRIDVKSEFVASSDNWFRPAQFACGPDGTLSVVDVYREVIEHPKSLPPDIKRHLDLTAGRDRGRIYRVTPAGYRHRPTPNLADAESRKLVPLLTHPNAWHRETAARLIYQRQDTSIVGQLRRQSDDNSSPLGRLHSLYSLDGLGALTADDLIDRFHDEHPQVIRHAIRLSESFPANQNVIDALQTLLDHPSIDVRYQLAFSLGQFAFADKPQWLAKILLQDPADRWIQTAVASSVDRESDQLLIELLAESRLEPLASFVQQLAIQIDRRDDGKARRQTLAAIETTTVPPSLLPTIQRLNRSDRIRDIGQDLFERIRAKSADLITLAIEQIADESIPLGDRTRAIQWVRQASAGQVLPTLLTLVNEDHPAALQLAAIESLGRYDSPSVTAALLDNWAKWSPRLRNAASNVLMAAPNRMAAVLQAIDDQRLDANDISVTQWNLMASSKHGPVRNRASQHLASRTSASRDSVINQYREVAKLSGNVDRGSIIYQKQCAGCHRVGQVGHVLGPSLAAAATRGSESILTNVLDPNREVNPQFINYVVLTVDGRTASGMIDSENANSITLKRAESVSETILRSDIELIRNTNQSIMPEGFEKAITPQAMADLIEYLTRATVQAAE